MVEVDHMDERNCMICRNSYINSCNCLECGVSGKMIGRKGTIAAEDARYCPHFCESDGLVEMLAEISAIMPKR